MAASSRRARSANASAPARLNVVVGGAQLLARVHAPVLAPEPFAVEQTGAGELDADPGALEPLDRLAVERLGGVALAHQRPRAGQDAERPIRARGARALLQPGQRGGGDLRLPERVAASTSSGSDAPA